MITNFLNLKTLAKEIKRFKQNELIERFKDYGPKQNLY